MIHFLIFITGFSLGIVFSIFIGYVYQKGQEKGREK